MNKNKVSVIIPAHNEGRFIEKTLESLKKNAASLLEIIVVVNGSRDKTLEISRRYADKVIKFSKAIGPSAARNEGAKVATGEILVFLDADTRVSENAVEEIAKNCVDKTVGVCSAMAIGRKDNRKLTARIFIAFKNFT